MGGSRRVRSGSAALALALGVSAMVLAPPPAHATRGITTRVSVAGDGSQGNDYADYPPAISDSGRFIAFQSNASNLVPGDTNNVFDTFVHDRRSGGITRVSVSSDGTQGNGGTYGRPALSADGRYVAFSGTADNLVEGDTNGQLGIDVFVHDRETGATTLVSKATDGTHANGQSLEPAISGDGRYVAFATLATNLVTGDPGDRNGVRDVYVHDRQTATTTLVSESTTFPGHPPVRGQSDLPAISADGRYVAFESAARDLVSPTADPTDNIRDIFVRDLQEGTTRQVTVLANGHSNQADISAEGRYVAFSSDASNLSPGDGAFGTDVFVKDLQTQVTTRVTATDGQALPGSVTPALSGDGRYVAFRAPVTDARIYLHDLQARTTSVISNAPDGSPANGASFAPAIDARGFRIAFSSDASNLVAGDTNGKRDVFVNNRKLPVSVSVGDVTVHEGDDGTRTAAFTVSLSKPAASTVTVHYLTADGTAGGADYTPRAGTVSFAPGVTGTTVKVPVAGDTTAEGDEVFSVTVSSPTGGAVIGDSTGAGTIVDDDAAADATADRRLAIGDVSVHEGDAGIRTAVLTVSLSSAATSTVTVRYATADGTATATGNAILPADYVARSGTLTFAPGVTSAIVKVPVNADLVQEGNQSFSVVLSKSSGPALADDVGTATVVDDE